MKREFVLLPVMLCASAVLLAEGPAVYAIHDARVIRVSGPPLEHASVVVRNGLIEAVGENITPPADAWIIEGRGLTVYPGLIDALSTIGIPGAAAPPTAATPGRTGGPRPVAAAPLPTPIVPPASPAAGPEDRPSNTSFLRAADQIVAADHSVELARDGGFTTAVTFPINNIFAGQGVVFDLSGTRTGEMVIDPSAGQYITLRSNGFTSFPGSLMGVIAYIRQIYLDSDHYKVAKAIYDKHPNGLERPAYDRTLEGVIQSPRVLLPAHRAVEVDRMLQFARELKSKPVLYGGEEAWRVVDSIKKSGAPVLVTLKWPEKAKDLDPAINEPLRVLEIRDKAPSTPGVLAKNGILFAFYTDGIATPKEILKAAQKAIDAGLAPSDAIRAFTLNAAEIYGLADRLGSIDKGKIANLVVTDGDLFADKTQIKYVFVDGNKFEPAPESPDAKPDAKKDMEKTQ